jgi:WD40 repeat protein
MDTFRTSLALPVLLLGALAATAQPPAPKADPLPKGALQRLGTLHYRQDTPIHAFAFAADGQTCATAAHAVNGSSVRLWQTATGKQLASCPVPARIEQLAFAPDGQTCAAGCGRDLVLIDVKAGKELRRFEAHPGGVASVAWSPDGKTLAVGGDAQVIVKNQKHTIRLLDAGSGKLLRTLEEHSDAVATLAFAPDGKRLASASCGGIWNVCLWDTATGKRLHQFECGKGSSYRSFSRLLFSSDLALAALCASGCEIQVWDVPAARQLWCFTDPHASFAFTGDGKHLAVAQEFRSGAITLYEARTGKAARTLDDDSPGQRLLGADTGGKYLAATTAGYQYGLGRLRVWDLAAGKELTAPSTVTGPVLLAGLTPDGKHVVTAADDGSMRLWDVATGQAVKVLKGGWGQASNFALAQDARTLAWIDQYGSVKALKVPAWQPEPLPGGPDFAGGALALTADGRLLAAGNARGRVLLWDLEAGKLLGESKLVAGDLRFTGDGRLLSLFGGTARLWRVGGAELLDPLRPLLQPDLALPENNGANSLGAAALSPDGRWLLTARAHKSGSRLWLVELDSGQAQLVADLPQAAGLVAFAPDGLTVATAGGLSGSEVDRAVSFWDVASGELLGRLDGHLSGVTSLVFTADGQRLLTGGTEGTVLIWDTAALPKSRVVVPRKLTPGDLEPLWAQLVQGEPLKAYRAMLTMAAGGEASLDFLQGRLEPAALLSEAELKQLIADLDDSRYAVRDKASALLATQGERGAKALRAVLRDPDITLEMRRRAELVLPKLERYVPAPKELQTLRALAVLEYIGDEGARKLVTRLAEGAPQARLTQQARATLGRWKSARG